MLIESISLNLQKAYPAALATGTSFTQQLVQYAVPAGDGFINSGYNGTVSQNRILLAPYARAGAGLNFNVRLYGWRQLGPPGYAFAVWAPFLLCELACTTCNLAGVAPLPGGVQSPFTLTDQDSLCDTIALVQGDLGLSGRINANGSDLAGYAIINIQGEQILSLDFAQQDLVPPQAAMNSLWTFC